MAYLLALLTVLVLNPRLSTDPRQFYAFYMLMGLIFTFSLVLLDSWRMPLIFSSRVLRALEGIEEFRQDILRDERAYASAIAYLESLGQGGRWRTGNLLSLLFFIIYLIWGLVALRFPDLTGIEDGVANLAVFFAFHLPSAWLMFWIYHRALRKMAADAASKGFPFLDVRQG